MCKLTGGGDASDDDDDDNEDGDGDAKKCNSIKKGGALEGEQKRWAKGRGCQGGDFSVSLTFSQ